MPRAMPHSNDVPGHRACGDSRRPTEASIDDAYASPRIFIISPVHIVIIVETGKNNTLRGLFSLFLLEAMEIMVTFANKSG